ncbi:MAG TPA: potassium transporter KefB [Cyclobacteriaceae bacterium]|nr:potassium transporter KefB [Cyclobacteriaceae bacterium]
MTQTNPSTTPTDLHLSKRMTIGAAFGLMVILFFVLGVDDAPAEWGKFWMIRPLLVETFAGAMAGACNYFLVHHRGFIGLNKTIAMILSVIVSFVGLWIGIVLGLVGTMWN